MASANLAHPTTDDHRGIGTTWIRFSCALDIRSDVEVENREIGRIGLPASSSVESVGGAAMISD